MRRALRALSTVLILSGTLLIADAGVTLAWQEPVSALYAKVTQDRLEDDLRSSLDRGDLTELQLRALTQLRTEQRRIAFLARALRRKAKEGSPIGRLRLGRLDKSYVVVQGTRGDTLRKGPGHYRDTAFPGLPGTVAIAGHRTTYLAPFRRINELRKGDSLTLETPYARLSYAVERTEIVGPNAYRVVRRVGHDRLVLTACHPLYSAAERIVVFARLTQTEALGLARVGGPLPGARGTARARLV
jgi:sortase A